MNDLASKNCLDLTGNESPLSAHEAQELLKQLHKEWCTTSDQKIRRQFTFDSFTSAIEFVSKVATIAEEQNHHPDITINYKRVTLELTTHDVDGLSENDFIVAAKIDTLTA